jgi:hypothetical protein
MRRGFLFLAALAAGFPSAFARNIAITAGGDCIDGRPAQEFFRRDSKFVHEAFEKMGWESHRVVRDDNEGSRFTLNAMFAPLAGRELGEGDQVLLHINTHGSEAGTDVRGKPIEHGICVDGAYLPVSKLTPKLDELAARGVKVALLDSSCYGGSSLSALAGKNVCVVSATTDNVTNSPPDIALAMVAQAASKRITDAASRKTLFAKYSGGAELSKAEKRDVTRYQALHEIYGQNFPDDVRAELVRDFQRKHGASPTRGAYENLKGKYAERLALSEALFDRGKLQALAANDVDGLERDGSISAEELFLASRTHGPFGHAGMTPQISSDIEGRGYRLGHATLPLTLKLERAPDGEPGEGCGTTALFEDFAEILTESDRVLSARASADGLNERERAMLRASLRKIGFKSFAEARKGMEQLLGRKGRAITTEEYNRYEKAYYLAQYLDQRKRTASDARAKACADFRF